MYGTVRPNHTFVKDVDYVPTSGDIVADDVVVYLRQPEGDGETLSAVLVKQLVKRTASAIVLRQLNPLVEFSLDSRRVMMIHRVLTNADLYGGYR